MFKIGRRGILKGLFGGLLSSPLLAKLDFLPEVEPRAFVPPVKVKTSGTRLFVNGNEISQVLSISGPSYESTVIDVTSLESECREFKPIGLPDFGEVSIETLEADPALFGDDLMDVKIVLGDDDETEFSFQAYCTSKTVSVAVDDPPTVTAQLRMASSVTVT